MNRISLLLIAGLVNASPLSAAEPNATDPTASSPAVKYQSAFEGYRSYKEQPIADWRTLNADVGVAGGHTGIMGGAGSHAGHGAGVSKPAAAKPATADGGQAPVRGAPKAPGGGAHGQH